MTGVPKSARQAEMMVPRYPDPYTPICMQTPELPPARDAAWDAACSPTPLFNNREGRLATHDRVMYPRPRPGVQVTSLPVEMVWQRSAGATRDQSATERDPRQVDPAIRFLLADK